MNEAAKLGEKVILQSNYEQGDGIKWGCKWRVDKYWGSPSNFADARPYETIFGQGNTLTNGGADLLWNRTLVLNPTTLATIHKKGALSNGRAGIGVGDTSDAAAAGQTDLVGATGTTSRRIRGMSTAAYPAHTTGTSTAARTAQFQAIFTTTEANFAWKEWCITNFAQASSASAAIGGTMLNRKAQDLGTKTAAATWTFTASLTLS
ncbi:MAG TPA: hypothetical protein VM243_14630 [Phycisphaerae bacterium]|nr:hypothetical protein [Phycisphaerae bacterium]